MIFFSDFDDTLYLHENPDGTAKNLAAIQAFRAAGHKFCLATGRSFSSVARTLPDFANYFDYLVLDNGAVCTDVKGKELFDFPLSEELTREIIDFLSEKFPDEKICNVFYYDMTEHQAFDRPVTKLRCWTKEKSVSEKIFPELSSAFGDKIKAFIASVARPSGIDWIEGEDFASFIDITPMDAGKERAVPKLAEMVAPGEPIVVIGDSINDNAMLAAFDGYAVANADPKTLSIVKPDHVVQSVAELLSKLTEE